MIVLRDLLGRRVDLDSVFDRPDDCLRAAARLSGGRLRDVFHVTQLACDLGAPERVTMAHVEAAGQKLTAERAMLVKLPQWPRLAEIHRDKQVANDPGDGYLILHSLVLNYDSVPWWDVHPLARVDRRFDVAWRNLSRIAT